MHLGERKGNRTTEFPDEPLTKSLDGRLTLESIAGRIVVTDIALAAREADRRRAFLARLAGD